MPSRYIETHRHRNEYERLGWRANNYPDVSSIKHCLVYSKFYISEDDRPAVGLGQPEWMWPLLQWRASSP